LRTPPCAAKKNENIACTVLIQNSPWTVLAALENLRKRTIELPFERRRANKVFLAEARRGKK
jgi:endonuclease III-like uncharacterized protein